MTNLSKELCEICGIKPKLNCINCPHPCETACNNCSYSDLNYPDFEQSENFVKLLKIANDVLGSVHFATAYTKNKPNIFEEQALMHYLPMAKLNEAFKQAIRETEWVYE